MQLGPVFAREIVNQIGRRAFAFIAAIEVGTDFVRGANAIPDAEFGEPSRGAFGWSRPSNPAMFEFLRRRFALVGVEFAILIEAKLSGRIARDGNMSPRIGDDLFVGDDRVVDISADPDAQFCIVKINIENTGRAKNAIAVADARIEFDPRLDGE